jgi:uncharacterized membrane protein YvlD (DUF360 family)
MRRLLSRLATVVLVDAGTLLLLSALLPGFTADSFGAALILALLLALANALVWPLLIRFALPFTVLTLGLGALALNALVLLAIAQIDYGVHVRDFGTALVVTLLMTAITSAVGAVLALDSGDLWTRHVVVRQLKRTKLAVRSDVPGILFLEIDGLAHDVLRRALRDGNAPTLSRWVHDGGHRLERWETNWSSQTGACQAGILHGSNENMPAFRWWEKDRGAAIVTNHPRDAAELERRHSDGRGLLHGDGASRANILSGDAPHSMLTMSTALRRRRPIGKDYAAYFVNPYAVARTLALSLAEIARERRAARSQVRDDVRPRMHRSRGYVFARAWGTVVQRDLQVATVIGDVLAGRPVIYTTFLAYDEVAHHSGIERHDALAVLRDLDRQIARIARACEDAPRPYRLVVLSDHGQSQGETFRDRYDQTLEELVQSACEADSVVASEAGDDDSLSYLSAGLTEVARDDTMAARTVRAATRDRLADGAVALDADSRREVAQTHDGEELPELSVMASGCLGLITFPREPGRVSLERIEALYPRLIPALRDHPGVGFILVRSEREGAVAIGAGGTRYLADDRVEGEDPLAPFGENAADHLRRTDGFEHCADLIINSTYGEDFGEVAAFEELVGSHGGMGGTQSFPFVLHPSELKWPAEEVVGAERVHRVFRGWLARLGQTAYASEADSPGESTRVPT